MPYCPFQFQKNLRMILLTEKKSPRIVKPQGYELSHIVDKLVTY